MSRFINLLLVGLFATYFYLEYQEPNSVGATPTSATQVVQVETDPAVAPDQSVEPAVETQVAAVSPTATSDAVEPEALVAAAPETQPMTPAEVLSARVRFLSSEIMAQPAQNVPDPDAPAPGPTILRVTGAVVNARSGPGTNFQVLTRLQRGDELFATGDTDGDWARAVVAETGEEVWMHREFLAEAG